LPYIFPVILRVYIYSDFCGGVENMHIFSNRVRIGHSRSSKVDNFGTNRQTDRRKNLL